MPTRQIKNSYNKGEMSPYMDGRTDITHYYNGCSKLINALVLPHGGFTKRPGTEYKATAANKCNLFPFEFSVDDALILEFSNLLLRFYKDQAIVNKGVGTEDVSTVDGGALLAHWLLNEISGVTAVNDDVPGTHDGTISVDASTIHEDGKVGTGCFNLNGLYTVTVGDDNVFSFTTGAADKTFSIACWAYVTEQGGIQVLVSKWQDEATAREWRFILTADRKLQLEFADSSATLESDRIAQWKLNDNAGDQAVDDIVASIPHDGLTETANTTDLTATGKLNACFDLAGADCVIITNDHNELSFDDSGGAGPFSIAAWVYVTDSDATQVILSKFDETTGAEAREWLFDIGNQKKLLFLIFDESANAYRYKVTNASLSVGWHFVVATYDGSGGDDADDGITLYVDNVEVNQTGFSIGTYVAMENLATKVVIGALEGTDGNYGKYWQDKIDNVVLYNIELSAANVSTLWNDGNGTEATTSAGVFRVTDDALTTGWHFLCCTLSAFLGGSLSADDILLYVDGVAVDATPTIDTTYTAMQNAGIDVRIGSQLDSAGTANENFWQDKIDEVSIFSDKLTSTEVASLYSTTPYSIVSPYTSAEAFQIHVTQSADVMYIAHEDHHPKKLSRYDALDWRIEDVDFKGGPFLFENTESDYIVGFARTGGTARSAYYFPAGAIGTLTASDVDAGNDNQPFNSDMVGALWLIKHTRDVDNDTDTFAKDTNVVPTLTTYASGAIHIKGNATATFEPIATGEMAQLWRKEGNGKWQTYRSFRASTAFSWTEDADDVLYAMTRDAGTINGTLTAKEAVNRGIVKITGYTSSTVVTVEVIDKVLSNNTNDNAVTTSMWSEGAWSDYRGYPRTVTFFEDRLWWASSTNNPDTKWGSKSRLYENMEFSNLGLDNDAITAPLNDNEISQIQWMFPRTVMAVGAANKEYRFGAANPDDPVTPADRKATPQTSFGSDSIQPVILQDALFFLQRQGKKLRAMKFDSITENFTADDATLLAYGIFDSAPTCMAVQRSPDSIIWIPRADGVMPTFTYEPVEEVAGWARQLFGNSADVDVQTGYIESVAVIHGSAEDEVWVSVRRVIDSGTVYYVEKFKPRSWGSDIEDACFVDSAVTYDGGLVWTVTAAHLKGETVSVFADGVVFDDAVANISTGVVTLKKATVATQASVVQLGIPYTMKARTMRLAVPPPNTIQTRIKRINRTVVRYIRSLLGSAGQEYGGTEHLTDIKATYSTSSADTPKDNRLTSGGFNEDAYTIIVSDDPVPFTALATIIDVEVE